MKEFLDYIFNSYLGGIIFLIAGVWSIYNSYKHPFKSEYPSPLGGNNAGYVAGIALIIGAIFILRTRMLGHW